MIFRKEIEVEFDTDDFDFNEFDFSFDEIQDIVKYNLTKEEQNRIILCVMSYLGYNEIQDVFASILETLSIENAKEIIQNLDNRFLSLEQYRERALQLQRSSK